MNMTERVAYIRGLMEGLELDENKKEVKVLDAVIDLLDDMAATVSELEEGYQDMADQLDEVDADLGDLEEEYYGGGCDCDCDDDDCDCCCDDDDDDDLDELDDCYYEVTCPSCSETICLSEDLIAEGKIECPNCGETLEFDLDGIEEEEADCGCGCGCDCK